MTRREPTTEELDALHAIAAEGSYVTASQQWFRMARLLFAKLGTEKITDGIAFLDLTDVFDGKTGTMYLDFVHYNAAGSGLLAQRLGDEILARVHSDGSWSLSKLTSAVATFTGTPSSVLEQPIGEGFVLEGLDAGERRDATRTFRLYWRASAANCFLPAGRRWTEVRTLKNLVPNGDFENGLENGLPRGWPGTIYGEKSSGDYLLKLSGSDRVLRLRATDAKPRVGLYSQGIPVSPGRNYLVTGRALSHACKANAAVAWWGPAVSDSVRYYWALSSYNVPQWLQFSQIVKPVPGATQCSIWLTNTESRGDVYFDGIGMYDVEPPLVTVTKTAHGDRR